MLLINDVLKNTVLRILSASTIYVDARLRVYLLQFIKLYTKKMK